MDRRIIKNVLVNSRNKCKFKLAFIPKGWTCVNINKCTDDIVCALKQRRK